MVASNLIPDHTISSVTTSAVAVWLIQTLKNASWFPWLKAQAKVASRFASILLAAMGTAGLQWEWTKSTHTLVITNLTLGVVALGVWHCIQHFAMQEVIYQAAVNKPKTPADPGLGAQQAGALGAQQAGTAPAPAAAKP